MNNKKQLIVVFDMDECIGYWSFGGLVYNIYKYINIHQKKRAIYLFNKYIIKHLIRPRLDTLFKWLYKLKKKNIIKYIFLYTSNIAIDYPNFIIKCIEQYINTIGLFDNIFVSHLPRQSNQFGFKDLNCISNKYNYIQFPYNNVIIFDDRIDVWDKSCRHRIVKVPIYKKTSEINIKAFKLDLNKYFKIDKYKLVALYNNQLYYPNFYKNKLNIYSINQLLHLLSNGQNKNIKINDDIVFTLMYTKIKQFIKSNQNITLDDWIIRKY